MYIQLEQDMEAQIRSRSGLASKGLIVLNSPGTIDPDYRGEIKIILFNVSNQEKFVKNKEKVAQIIFSQLTDYTIIYNQSLSSTLRGEQGFGSTGQI